MYKAMVMQIMKELPDNKRRHAGSFISSFTGGKTLEELPENTMEKIYHFLRGYAGYGKA